MATQRPPGRDASKECPKNSLWMCWQKWIVEKGQERREKEEKETGKEKTQKKERK
jgi:poly(3-hydroxyalkanoate) synthetase